MQQLILIQFFRGLDTFLNIVSAALIIYALMTWFMRPDNPVYMFFARFADFVLTPFRPAAQWLFEKGLRMDLSVVLAVVCISVLRSLLNELLYGLIL